VAGQIGWELDGSFANEDFIYQFGRALDHVLDIVRAAGGGPESVASMTIFVCNIQEYRERASELGAVWKARFGRHYPAMALVGVVALVEPRAKVEIQAVAEIG
jgi:enamine deaminase RidA (YjgF/YER057c/UK114 family)